MECSIIRAEYISLALLFWSLTYEFSLNFSYWYDFSYGRNECIFLFVYVYVVWFQKKKAKKDPLLLKKSKNDPNAPPQTRIPIPEL